ncbi:MULTISPECIES: hypothetical protein [unclassified Streptomyces]|uniref:hypothetical protein n=1 Tax=unclassified Streptomyces TaxID=2593676 RepID=UPI002E14CE6D|nr:MULTISPECIES: hypothetical protein [unclassified Streptomyces]WSJ38305.1 hypothetical protein OG772_21350 [Streptomyces sp. NBC_01321]WSP64593.1 hypothetical protein OG466_23980 [Streptomyces sp. NBC_01240]WSU23740.1 hypothetical protein OG508_24245 [Streptomyces sp. NBC_01108]
MSACTASSGGPSGGPSDAPSGAVGKGGGYTLTVENAGARCAYATVKVRTEGGGSAGGRPGVIYSKAFSGGKVSLSGTSYGADGTATPLPEGELEGRAYISRPVGHYTAVMRDAGGEDVVTAEFSVTRTAAGKQRAPYPYLVEPSLFSSGEADPGEQVELTASDEGPDPEEKKVSASSDAFDGPAKLTFRGKAYEGEATIRQDADPGRYDVTVLDHFGCGRITGSVEVSD